MGLRCKNRCLVESWLGHLNSLALWDCGAGCIARREASDEVGGVFASRREGPLGDDFGVEFGAVDEMVEVLYVAAGSEEQKNLPTESQTRRHFVHEASEGSVLLVGEGPFERVVRREPAKRRVEHDHIELAADLVEDIATAGVDSVADPIAFGVRCCGIDGERVDVDGDDLACDLCCQDRVGTGTAAHVQDSIAGMDSAAYLAPEEV